MSASSWTTAVIAVIDKMLKQRRDSITQYQAAGRQDLVDAEQFEVNVLQAYMPASLSADEIAAAVAAAVTETGAAGPGDMGKVMGVEAAPGRSCRHDRGVETGQGSFDEVNGIARALLNRRAPSFAFKK